MPIVGKWEHLRHGATQYINTDKFNATIIIMSLPSVA